MPIYDSASFESACCEFTASGQQCQQCIIDSLPVYHAMGATQWGIYEGSKAQVPHQFMPLPKHESPKRGCILDNFEESITEGLELHIICAFFYWA